MQERSRGVSNIYAAVSRSRGPQESATSQRFPLFVRLRDGVAERDARPAGRDVL